MAGFCSSMPSKTWPALKAVQVSAALTQGGPSSPSMAAGNAAALFSRRLSTITDDQHSCTGSGAESEPAPARLSSFYLAKLLLLRGIVVVYFGLYMVQVRLCTVRVWRCAA